MKVQLNASLQNTNLLANINGVKYQNTQQGQYQEQGQQRQPQQGQQKRPIVNKSPIISWTMSKWCLLFFIFLFKGGRANLRD